MTETRKTAREAAARALFAIEENGAWSAQAVQREAAEMLSLIHISEPTRLA